MTASSCRWSGGVCFLLLAQAAATELQPTAPQKPRKPQWSSRLSTYSIASVARREHRTDWNEVTQGNKIVLPRSVYDLLVSRGISFKQFQILNPENREVRLFTGPLDFCAAEGECYLPNWVMRQLKLQEGDACAVATCRIPRGTFARFQPHSSSFLDVTDHSMMLHSTLDNFAALTAGSTIRVTDGRRVHMLDVLDVTGKQLPPGQHDDSNGKAIDLTLAELSTDFAPAKDVVKKKRGKARPAAAAEADAAADPVAEPATAAEAETKADSAAASTGEDGAEGAAPAAPVPKFKKRKMAAAAATGDGAEGAAEAGAEATAEAEGSSPAKFKGRARTLATDDDDDAASAKPASALAKAREARLKAKQQAEEAAAPPAPSQHPAAVALRAVMAVLMAVLRQLQALARKLLMPADVSFS